VISGAERSASNSSLDARGGGSAHAGFNHHSSQQRCELKQSSHAQSP
jgi:hypothetical protein